MPDGSTPNTERSIARKLSPQEIIDLNKRYRDRLKQAWVGHPVAQSIIDGEASTDAVTYMDDNDQSTWTHGVSRVSNARSRLVSRSQHFSAINSASFIEETVSLDDSTTRPSIDIRITVIGEPQFKSDDSTATIPFVEKSILRIEQQLNPQKA